MTTQSAPIFSLQAPKDVSLSEIEGELSKIWQSYGIDDDSGVMPAATRATTFSLIVYEPEETQQLLTALGFYSGPIDGIPGPRTEVALREAQKTYGLPLTGKATAETLTRLREELTKYVGSAASDGGNGTSSLSYALDTRSPAVADAIASRNPCRIIALCPVAGEDEGVKAQVSAYCPIHKQSQTTLVCCEYITLTGTVAALERVSGMVAALLIGDLPKFLWWKATPDPNNGVFKRLVSVCNSIIVDSSRFPEAEIDLLSTQELLESGVPVADLNWRRLSAWQELTAEAFDPPERRAALMEVDRVTIDYEKGNPAQALMFLGWLASRLHWRPTHIEQEEGDYDIKRIHFVAEDQRQVEAELAGVPTADVGEIPGDLIALRLTSTNLKADCCTVVCSETSGCMRMELGGGAQACRFQQVTALADQKAELLLSQQLQSWGRDELYEEGLAVTAQILKLGVRG
ncbi:glucose-6-phosphate dehydrogenase assembly protein OpcA [Chroococcidiopsis sp. CCMEE 29]|uniref:glucose-6-phosphate dehydrogenase assembly protein OpcA n=1 Tax=Chroococcidiopsis sp. CCMEE 29 TaxID=155894 RepID=UPI002020BE18|nr:glucose-6-phosphate dehydrogenase assembly protein OpcA [Chroococcidiopsis sp. CCMEE 29]